MAKKNNEQIAKKNFINKKTRKLQYMKVRSFYLMVFSK